MVKSSIGVFFARTVFILRDELTVLFCKQPARKRVFHYVDGERRFRLRLDKIVHEVRKPTKITVKQLRKHRVRVSIE